MSTRLNPRMIIRNESLTVSTAILTSLQTETINSTDILTQNLTATNAIIDTVITDFTVQNKTTDYTFTEADNSKVFHFDTTTTPSITATFPNTLPNGFNAGIINIGTGTIFVDSDPTLKAFSTENSTQNTGMFIYKTNNEFFGIGVFE